MEKKRGSRGRGRGVLALTSYEPCPRPSPETIGQWHQPRTTNNPHINKVISENSIAGQCADTTIKNGMNSGLNSNVNGCISTKDVRVINGQGDYSNKDTVIRGNSEQGDLGNKDKRKENHISDVQTHKENLTEKFKKSMTDADDGGLIAKYSYEAQPHKPGGFDELTIKQGEKLTLIQKGHVETKNDHWWKVKNELGESGFVPATFCYAVEKTPTALPWLENKRLLEEQEEKKRQAELAAKGDSGFGAPKQNLPKVKEYQSAYTNNGPPARNAAEAAKQYYCEVCDKNLNGPQPYKMHMSSKAHREEVEYQKSKNN